MGGESAPVVIQVSALVGSLIVLWVAAVSAVSVEMRVQVGKIKQCLVDRGLMNGPARRRRR